MGLPHHRRSHGHGSTYTPVATYFEWITNPSTVNFNALGRTTQVLAKVTDQFHVPLASQPAITYTSGTLANISISGNTLTAIANGTSLITASTAGFANITGTATVAQVVASVVISPSSPSITQGSTQQFTAVAKDALNNTITPLPAGTWSSSDPTDIPVDTNGLATGTNPNSAVIKWQASNGINGTASITVTAPATLIASPTSFSGATGATQQESFTYSGTDVSADVIAYSSDETIATISSKPDKPTVAAATNPTNSSLGIPITGTGPFGGVPTTVAVEVDEAGNGNWVRQTAVAWAGNKTATQTVTAVGLTASKDYTGKIRAVTINASGESYPSSAIPSGTTSTTPAGVNIPVGLSGVGVFSEDFSEYASTTAMRASAQLTFQNNSTYTALDSATQYNSHSTYKNRLLTDGFQGGIGTINPPAWSVNNATYRATIKFAAGTVIPAGGSRTLFQIFPKDMTSTGYSPGIAIVTLQIKDIGSGVLHYQLITTVQAFSGSIITSSVTTDLGLVGAELTSGYTIEYLLRITHTDSTHFVVTAWLAKNTGSTLTSAMRLTNTPVSRSMSTADTTFYQGHFRPFGGSQQSTPAAEQDNWIMQFEIIDETAHSDVYNLASALTTYTPLT